MRKGPAETDEVQVAVAVAAWGLARMGAESGCSQHIHHVRFRVGPKSCDHEMDDIMDRVELHGKYHSLYS